MISSEKEEIIFDRKIDPAKARGMVEKWLLQVESAMIENVRRVTLAGCEVKLIENLRRKNEKNKLFVKSQAPDQKSNPRRPICRAM